MSRIGKAPINIPAGVEITISKSNLVTVKGKNATLTQQVNQDLSIDVEEGVLTVKRPTEQKRHKAMHGLYRSLIANMVEGVSTGFKKELELVGVGYRASNQGQHLKVVLECSDQELIGEVAAKIRAFRKPEPYKGKGIRFGGEQIRRKAGKTAAK